MVLKTSLRKRLAKIKYPLKTHKPNTKKMPENIIQVSSAWIGLEQIIDDILDRFDIKRDKCIEFGTEYCYSTVVFSNYFRKVKGVDTFLGDVHSGHKADH